MSPGAARPLTHYGPWAADSPLRGPGAGRSRRGSLWRPTPPRAWGLLPTGSRATRGVREAPHPLLLRISSTAGVVIQPRASILESRCPSTLEVPERQSSGIMMGRSQGPEAVEGGWTQPRSGHVGRFWRVSTGRSAIASEFGVRQFPETVMVCRRAVEGLGSRGRRTAQGVVGCPTIGVDGQGDLWWMDREGEEG